MKPESSFRLLQRFTPDYSSSTISQYESEKTGMRVITIDRKGPRVTGTFVLATEIHDDSGAPHTLEHLCFMGSRNYPHPGFLDQLSNRMYASTNGYTEVDSTQYTLKTAGWEAFALLLPVYLDGILFPTLTDASCYTEVFHVDGSGHDAGVVYSEMQRFQNDFTHLIDIQCRKLLYSEEVGFRYDTGGNVEKLRTLTVDQIRDFHRKFYNQKNLCLILAGEIDHEDLRRVLEGFENSIQEPATSPETQFTRPWIDSSHAPPLERSVIDRIEFPEEDESSGEIEIHFLGPSFKDRMQVTALNIALLYLAGSSASVLENTLIEKEQLVSAVLCGTEPRPRMEIGFTLSGVQTDKLEAVERRFFEILREEIGRGINIEYMRECLHRHQRTLKFGTEQSPKYFIQFARIDFLFGERDGSTLKRVGTLEDYAELEQWSSVQWQDFIKKWLSDAHHVSVLGVPSAKLAERLKDDDEKRIESRKQKLGKEGLAKLAEELEKAKAINNEYIPREALLHFDTPNTESIHFISTTPARSGHALISGRPTNEIQELVDTNGTNLPLFIHFEHIPSDFVRFTLMISTEGIPTKMLPLLSIYTESFFSLPVEREGKLVSFEQVVMDIETDTVGYSMGLSQGNPELLSITMQVEVDKYHSAIKRLKELTWSSIFDIERLIATTAKLYAYVPEEKRDGEGMVNAIYLMLQKGQDSIVRAQSPLVKSRYLKRIKKLLACKPEEVVSHFEAIRKHLFQLQNFRVFVAADMKKITDPVAAWKTFIEGLDATKQMKPLIKESERLSEAGKCPGNLAFVVPMKTIDSSFAMFSAKGVDGYDDPRLPALEAAITYMNSPEGPLWNYVRGTGTAYGAYFINDISTGLVHLTVDRSPDVYKASEAAKKAVEDHVLGSMKIDSTMVLERAISIIVGNIARDQKTLYLTAQGNFVREVVHGIPRNYDEMLLKKVRAVDMEQVKEVLRDIILPLFTPGKANLFVTCAPALEKTISLGFKSAGFSPEIRSLREFEDDYGLIPEDHSDEDGDDDDDEDDDEEEDDEDSGEEASDEGEDGNEEEHGKGSNKRQCSNRIGIVMAD